MERFPSLVASFVDSLDLEDTYRLIAECDAFVGADGGNVNAAIALMRENVFPIFGLADPGSRLPADFPPDDVIRGRCPLAEHGCFAKMTPQDTRCEVTGQTDGEHSRTTPCMSDALVVDEIVVRLRRVFEQVRTARPRRAVA